MKEETIKKILEALTYENKCKRLSTSALIIKDKVIISLGYNGAVREADECIDKECLVINNHCERTCHAEENAIINASRTGVSVLGGEIYSLHFPCKSCIKMIVNSGIKSIFYFKEYEDEINKKLAKEFIEKKIIKIKKLEG